MIRAQVFFQEVFLFRTHFGPRASQHLAVGIDDPDMESRLRDFLIKDLQEIHVGGVVVVDADHARDEAVEVDPPFGSAHLGIKPDGKNEQKA